MAELIRFLSLDKYLIDKGMASTYQRAREIIKGGFVKVNDVVVTSPACPVMPNQKIVLLNMDHPWVSDHGKKLYEALAKFAVDLRGKVALDLGSGAGGFADVLLSRGVKKVYAVEKEFGKLDTSLILNERVKNIDRTDITNVAGKLEGDITLITYDIDEGSIRDNLPPLLDMVQSGADLIALVRPQLESETKDAPADNMTYKRIQKALEHWLRFDRGWMLKRTIDAIPLSEDSPREFFIWAQKP